MNIQELLNEFEARQTPFVLPQEGEQLGVELVKEIITDGFTLSEGVIDIFGGKLSQGLFKVAAVAAKYSDDFQNAFKRAIAELKDLDESEAQDIYDHVVREFDIENDELEAKIERIAYLPILGFAEYNDTIEAVKAIKPIVNNPNLNLFEKIGQIGQQVGPVAKQLEDLYNLVMEAIEAFSALSKGVEA